MKRHRYTEEQIQFIRDNAEGKFSEEIRKLVNARYDLNVTVSSVKNVMRRNEIKSGMQGYNIKNKSGKVSPNSKPVGSERLWKNSVWVKVSEPDKWVKKHILIWEKENGPIPEGYVLKFADGDRTNVTLENLFLTHSLACPLVVHKGLAQTDPELNKSVHKLVELELAINRIEKNAVRS